MNQRFILECGLWIFYSLGLGILFSIFEVRDASFSTWLPVSGGAGIYIIAVRYFTKGMRARSASDPRSAVSPTFKKFMRVRLWAGLIAAELGGGLAVAAIVRQDTSILLLGLAGSGMTLIAFGLTWRFFRNRMEPYGWKW